MKSTARNGVLQGIRVIDLTTFLSGPFATQTLGDMGAEIIKVETISGDVTRTIPPYFVGDDSVYYMSTNRNKKSISIDLKQPAGKEIIDKLIQQCDVVIENFRPGVAKRLGIDYETVKLVHPNIIYCSITGFGQTGPYSSKPAYDMIVQALGGTMSITGEKGGNPVRLGPPLGDLAAGLYSVIGILGAIFERGVNGQGKYIDISMLDCQLSLLSYLGAYHLHSGIIPSPQGREHDSIPTYRAIKAGDGEFVSVTANTQKMFESVCHSIEMEYLIEDPRFLDGELRLKHKNELIPILEEAFLKLDSATILQRLEANDVPCAPIKNVKEALENPLNQIRNMVVTVPHKSGTDVRLIDSPIKYDQYADEPHGYPPLLGEHTLSILQELGYSNETIAQFISDKTVFAQESN